MFLILSCVSILMNANLLYSRYGADYQKAFAKSGTADRTYAGNSLEGLAAHLSTRNTDGFFRVSAGDTLNISTNANMPYDFNDVSDFEVKHK